MLKSFLFKIKDHRRRQGLRYELEHILLFSILANLSRADSYQKILKFILTHYKFLVTTQVVGLSECESGKKGNPMRAFEM